VKSWIGRALERWNLEEVESWIGEIMDRWKPGYVKL